MKYAVILLLAGILLFPAVLNAQQCRLLMMADELKLTDDQIDQIRANALVMQKEMIQLRADLKKAKLDLREMMLAKKIDRKAAEKKAEDIAAIKANMEKKKISSRIDQLNMLDDTQRDKVRRQMMFRDGRGRDRSGMGMGPFHGLGTGPGVKKFYKKGMGGQRNIEVIIEEELDEDDD